MHNTCPSGLDRETPHAGDSHETNPLPSTLGPNAGQHLDSQKTDKPPCMGPTFKTYRCMKIYRCVAPNVKDLNLQRVFQTSRPTWTVDQRLHQASLSSRCSRPLGRHRAAPDRHRPCMPAWWRVHDSSIASEGGHTGRAQAEDILYGECRDDALAGACPVTHKPFPVTHVVWGSRKGARDTCQSRHTPFAATDTLRSHVWKPGPVLHATCLPHHFKPTNATTPGVLQRRVPAEARKMCSSGFLE